MILPPGEGIVFGSLLVENGVITEVIPMSAHLPEVDEDHVFDCEGDFLAPGLVDIHCHGAVGRDAMEATPEAFGKILNYHASRGTTTTVLTTVAASLPEMLAVLECAKGYRSLRTITGSKLIGIHIEGPYFSPYRRGAHRAEMLRYPFVEETSQLLNYADVIRRMTIAPELPGALDLVRELCRLGVAASAGHSDATEEEALAGFHAGISQVTHLHNAMSSMRKTAPEPRRGLAEAALETPGIVCELIADGVHVALELLREAWLAKGWKEIALISDATAGAGLKEGDNFRLGELVCMVEERGAWTGEGSARCLAGSTATLLDGVRTMVSEVGVPLVEAVAMATLVPANILGLEKSLGSLSLGKVADMIRFNSKWNMKGVWVGGSEFFPFFP
jgi:N-acetylglucosamine-6-phosphate deacetylase